jgi:hypothetical protein
MSMLKMVVCSVILASPSKTGYQRQNEVLVGITLIEAEHLRARYNKQVRDHTVRV